MDKPDEKFLQMFVRAFIIAQSQLYKRTVAKRGGKFVDEFPGVFEHPFQRLAQVEMENNGISRALFVESVAYLMRETFEGSPEGLPGAYLGTASPLSPM
jgi:hypothetical protein